VGRWRRAPFVKTWGPSPKVGAMAPGAEGMSDAVKERVMKESKEGKIPCAKALALAKELGVTPAEVGKAANETKVKVVSCQLGCFD